MLVTRDAGWRAAGVVVLAYAPGYWWAARDPAGRAHFVAVGLLGKTLGPVAFAAGALVGSASPWLGLVVLTNDVVWWPAFAAFMCTAVRFHGGWRAFLCG